MKKKTEVDTSNADPSYWEDALCKLGLSMERGATVPNWLNTSRGGKDVISYIGTSNDLVNVESEQYSKKTGKKRKS